MERLVESALRWGPVWIWFVIVAIVHAPAIQAAIHL